MVTDEDRRYYERRAEMELEMAAGTDDPKACASHYTLASLYLALVFDEDAQVASYEITGHWSREPHDAVTEAAADRGTGKWACDTTAIPKRRSAETLGDKSPIKFKDFNDLRWCRLQDSNL